MGGLLCIVTEPTASEQLQPATCGSPLTFPSMQRKFLSNLAFLLLVNLLIKPIWVFGIDRTVQNEVGAASYGLYFAVFNFSFLFSMVLDFGINNFNNRAIARHEGLLQQLLPNIFITKWLFSLLYVVITITTALVLDFSHTQVHLLWFLVINQILVSFVLYFRTNISALHLFRLDAILSVLDKVLMIVIIGILLWGNLTTQPFRIEWLVYGQTLAYAITALVAFVLVNLKARGVTWSWNAAVFRRIIRLSWPFALVGLLMSIYNRIDAVMIERMIPNGKEEAGIYAASYRILDFFNMIGFAFATILLPMYARMLKRKIPVSRLVGVAARTILSISVPVVCGCVFYRHEIMTLLYTDANVYWSDIFGLLTITFAGVSLTYVFGTLLTANGNLREMNLMAVGTVVLNITLNALLIPKYHALGATIATVVTQFIAAGVQIAICQSLFRFRVRGAMLLRTAFFAVVCVGVFVGMMPLPVPWLMRLSIGGLLCIGSALILRVVDVREMRGELTKN